MSSSNGIVSARRVRTLTERASNRRGMSEFVVGPRQFPGQTSLSSTKICARLLIVVLLMKSGSKSFEFVSCEPAQQRGQAQAPQQQLQQSSELAGLQDSSMQFVSGGGGASLGEGLTALAGGYRRGPYTNTKRARKMSAFMPMRGRKDGRDFNEAEGLRSQLARYLNAVQQQQQQLGQTGRRFVGGPSPIQMRESDPTEASLVRLMNGHGVGSAIPAQFFQQLHQANQQQQQQQQTGGLALRPAALSLEQVASGQNMPPPELMALNGGGDGGQMMEAKLRRAFHPMRGKKAAAARTRASPSLEERLWSGFRVLVASDNDETELDEESEF